MHALVKSLLDQLKQEAIVSTVKGMWHTLEWMSAPSKYRQGTKIFRDEKGRRFHYERGHRVYVEKNGRK